MRRIAVLTSGGDAPGMNAAIRAVIRNARELGMTVLGVRNGFAGLMAGTMAPLGPRDVGGILQHGGTLLGSARCPQFEHGCLVGWQHGDVARTAFAEVVTNTKSLDPQLLALARVRAQ